MRVFTCDQCFTERIMFSLTGLHLDGVDTGTVDFCSERCFWLWTKANYDRAMAPPAGIGGEQPEGEVVDAEFELPKGDGLNAFRGILYCLAAGALIAGIMLLWWWLK